MNFVLALAVSAHAQQGTPEPVTVGFGVGVVAPSSPLAPNTASARVRVSETVTLSPTLDIAFASSSTSSGGGENAGFQTRDTNLGVGVEVLNALAQRGTTMLQLAVGGRLGFDTFTEEPNEPDEIQTTTRSVNVYYGLGVEHFFGGNDPHFSVSAHGLNTLLTVASSTVDDRNTDVITDTNSTLFGVIWDPSVRMMVHIYF